MGLQTKSKRNENEPVTISLDDMDFVFAFDSLEKEIKLDEKGIILLKKAVEVDGLLFRNKKRIKAGDYEVSLNASKEVNDLWIYSFDKLLEYELIEKVGTKYKVTDKGQKYYKTL